MAHLKLIILWGIILMIPCNIFAQKDSVKVDIYEPYFIDLSKDNIACNALSNHSYTITNISNEFLLKELMTATAECVYRYRQNAFALRCSHFGYSQYGEFQMSAGYSRTFGKRLAWGLRFHYLVTHAAEYPNIHSFTFDISCYVAASRNIGIGFSVYNPACLKYGVTGSTRLPTRFHTLLNYKIGKNVLLSAELEKELKTQFEAAIGATYRIKCLFLTIKCRLPTPDLSANVRILARKFLFGTDCSYQPRIGFSPKVSFAYIF